MADLCRRKRERWQPMFSPVTSTFDIQSLVSQLMALERQPLEQLQGKKTTYQAQIDVWNDIRTSLLAVQTALDALTLSTSFLSKTATTSDSEVVTATAGTNASGTTEVSETTYTFTNITMASAAAAQSSSALGLSAGTVTTLAGGEEINTEGGDAGFNERIDSGSLNLDSDKAIVSGSFFVNGKAITVAASDTIMTILGKINSSGAGVTATLDSDTVTITQDTVGPNYFVNLESDTTGFFDAMKLTAGNGNPDPSLTAGAAADAERDLDETPLVGTLQDGYFTINDITFAVDVSEDSLSDLIGEINASAAGVLAFYDSVDDTVTLTSSVAGEDIVLSNDTANFFSELNIATGTHSGTGASFTLNGQALTRDSNTFTINGTTFVLQGSGTASVTVAKDTDAAAGAVQGFVSRYNEAVELIHTKLTAADSPLKGDLRLKSLQRRLRSYVYTSVANPGTLTHLSQVGVTIDHDTSAKTLVLDSTALADALEDGAADVFELFAYDSDGDGRYDDGGFANVLDEYLDDYTHRFDGSIVERNELIEDRIDTVERKIARMEKSLALREQRLIAEYERLFSLFQQLQAQSTGAVSVLTQDFSSNNSSAASLL